MDIPLIGLWILIEDLYLESVLAVKNQI